ncbi:MAG: hypothetical protein CMJ64_27620 [Planctomycetaceae bacterium]|nr:hypothetical protein [Planctomycetaceae bacterium]
MAASKKAGSSATAPGISSSYSPFSKVPMVRQQKPSVVTNSPNKNPPNHVRRESAARTTTKQHSPQIAPAKHSSIRISSSKPPTSSQPMSEGMKTFRQRQHATNNQIGQLFLGCGVSA